MMRVQNNDRIMDVAQFIQKTHKKKHLKEHMKKMERINNQ